MDRLLARETNVSDLLQFLTDSDPLPWADLVGWVPVSSTREQRLPRGHLADLVLTASDGGQAVLELKIGHELSDAQRTAYEQYRDARPEQRRLVLLALAPDGGEVAGSDGWTVLRLSQVAAAWSDSANHAAREVAALMTATLGAWDTLLEAVLLPSSDPRSEPLDVLPSKFLARVASREIARRLSSGRSTAVDLSESGVTSGGGLALVQAWTELHGDPYRCLLAEVRWKQFGQRLGAELRFGVDFWDEERETRESREAAWRLARAMSGAITADALRAHFAVHLPEQVVALRPGRSSRSEPVPTWGDVVDRGFASPTNPGGVPGNRRSLRCGFVGDGTRRFEEAVTLDTSTVTAGDLVDLIRATLDHLVAHLPEDYEELIWNPQTVTVACPDTADHR